MPPLSCSADGFEGTIYVFDWRKPTVTADFGCGFEFDGASVRIVPSGEVCTDTDADADASGERRPFIVHCKLPDGTWDVGLPTGGSFQVKVERGLMNCTP